MSYIFEEILLLIFVRKNDHTVIIIRKDQEEMRKEMQELFSDRFVFVVDAYLQEPIDVILERQIEILSLLGFAITDELLHCFR